MNKEDILKAFPDYEEITVEKFDTAKNCMYIQNFKNNLNERVDIYLKPKQKFPIVFENVDLSNFIIKVFSDGDIIMELRYDTSNYLINHIKDLPLLEQAIAKSKEIRGLK